MNEPLSPPRDAAVTPSPPRASSGFVRAFLASAVGTGLARVLGMAREVVMGNVIGPGAVTDAFLVAYTVPGIFRRFVADEGLTGALVPAVAKAEEEEGAEAARRLANTLLTAILLANLLLCGVAAWQAEAVVLLLTEGWAEQPEKLALAVSLTRWLLPFLAFVSLVSYAEGLLNYRGHFFVPKFAPALVSAGMITAVLLPGPWEPVWALAAGTLVGGLVHLLVCVPPLLARWGTPTLGLDFANPRFRQILRELSKVVAIGVFAQLNTIVIRRISSGLGDGAVTWFWNATRLIDLAQGIIAVAIGSALLPAISRSVADADWDRFRRELHGGLTLAGFVLLPTALGLAAFATPLTSLLFLWRKYTWIDVQWTAHTLALLTPFTLGLAGIQIVKKAYFAVDDRNTLLAVGAAGVALTWILGVELADRLGIPGLGLALSISTVAQLVLYLALLRRRLGARVALGSIVAPLGRMTLASLPPAGLLALAARAGDWSAGQTPFNLLLAASALVAAFATYVGLAHVLGIAELEDLKRRLRGRLPRSG